MFWSNPRGLIYEKKINGNHGQRDGNVGIRDDEIGRY